MRTDDTEACFHYHGPEGTGEPASLMPVPSCGARGNTMGASGRGHWPEPTTSEKGHPGGAILGSHCTSQLRCPWVTTRGRGSPPRRSLAAGQLG